LTGWFLISVDLLKFLKMIRKLLDDIVQKGKVGDSSSSETELTRRHFLRRNVIPALVMPALVLASGSDDSSAYKTGDLEGECLVGYYTWYTGIKGTVPSTVGVDFKKQLDSLWGRKLKRTKSKVVRQAYDTRVKEYLDPKFKPTRVSVEQYLRNIAGAVNEVKRNIDWGKVGSLKGLDSRREKLVSDISLSLDGKDILSYALTELMALDEGGKNIKVLDFLLRNAGEEYVGLIPALGDDLLSFGPYQFTSYAIYDANGETRGASIVNMALNKEGIPGSVIYLKGDDHHKAAYLFAIGNIADMVRGLDASQLSRLESCKGNKRDIVQYIATAHHSPGNARSIAKKWLDKKGDYGDSCYGRFVQYAEKTRANYDSLEGVNRGIVLQKVDPGVLENAREALSPVVKSEQKSRFGLRYR